MLNLNKKTLKIAWQFLLVKLLPKHKITMQIWLEILNTYVLIFSVEDEDEIIEEEDILAPAPPDGGWGWVVCAASFLCNMILDGIAYCFGVLLTPLCKYFDSDPGTVSWVGSLLCGVYLMSGPVVGGLVNKFGCRPVCIAGNVQEALIWGQEIVFKEMPQTKRKGHPCLKLIRYGHEMSYILFEYDHLIADFEDIGIKGGWVLVSKPNFFYIWN